MKNEVQIEKSFMMFLKPNFPIDVRLKYNDAIWEENQPDIKYQDIQQFIQINKKNIFDEENIKFLKKLEKNKAIELNIWCHSNYHSCYCQDIKWIEKLKEDPNFLNTNKDDYQNYYIPNYKNTDKISINQLVEMNNRPESSFIFRKFTKSGILINDDYNDPCDLITNKQLVDMNNNIIHDVSTLTFSLNDSLNLFLYRSDMNQIDKFKTLLYKKIQDKIEPLLPENVNLFKLEIHANHECLAEYILAVSIQSNSIIPELNFDEPMKILVNDFSQKLKSNKFNP